MVNEGRLVNEKRRALVNDIYERYTTEIENSFVNTTICENNDLRSKRVTGTKQTDIVFEHMDSVSAVMKYAGGYSNLEFCKLRNTGRRLSVRSNGTRGGIMSRKHIVSSN